MYLIDDEATVITCHTDVEDGDRPATEALQAARQCGATSVEMTVSPVYPGNNQLIEQLTALEYGRSSCRCCGTTPCHPRACPRSTVVIADTAASRFSKAR